MPSHPIRCPQCSSENIIFSKKRGVHVCEDCEHAFTLARPFVQKRLFISYGHDEHITLALRLRDDLRARGHDVWFDEERLKPGHDWEHSIEQGLEHLAEDRAHAAVLLLLTPHAVRRPDGYCLNEVARTLGRNLPIIPIMVVESEPPLSICRLQWLDMRECLPLHEKAALYPPRLERLLAAIEEDRLDFEGTQSRLLGVLQPIRFSADILKLLRDFTGRKWVFDEVDAWLKDPAGPKLFWITGAPGVGKSAIAAWIRDHRREIAAFHFCDISSEEKRNPAKLVCSLVYQLSTQLPEYEARLDRLPLETILQETREAYTLFDRLLIQPLAENFPLPDRSVVVLIDALDEATWQRHNEIVGWITSCADKTPPWLRFLVTSRPEPEIVASFQKLAPYVLDTAHAENLRDLGAFLHAQLPGITAAQTSLILKRSEGVFLYVRHVVDAVRSGQLSLQRPEEFPRGLGDVYQQFFRRQFGADLPGYEARITPVIQPVLAAYEPITLAMVQGLAGITTDTELARRLNQLGSLFPSSGEGRTATVRPFHRSLVDWITRRESSGHFVIAVSDGHRQLATHGWSQFEQAPEAMDDYFLQWLPSHLFAVGDEARAATLLKDFRFMMRRLERGVIEQTLKDYRELPAALTTRGKRLEFEAAFFREKSHVLRRGTPEWPAHKILLQLAVEHADDSPLTSGADRFLTEGRCDWIWLRRNRRPHQIQVSPCVAVFEGHSKAVLGAAAAAHGRILSWSRDNTLRAWDGLSGKPLAVMEGHSSTIAGAQVLPDSRILSWSWDKTLRLWDGQDGRPFAILEGHSDWVLGAQVLPNGRILSWSSDDSLRLWDSCTGLCHAVLDGHSRRIEGALALPEDRILSWSLDKTLRIWSAHSGACFGVCEGHSDGVSGALALRDGRVLSWSSDSTLRLWEIPTGTALAVLRGHERPVEGVWVMPQGILFTWANDGTQRLWDGASGEMIERIEEWTSVMPSALALTDGRILSWDEGTDLLLWTGRPEGARGLLEGPSGPASGVFKLSDGSIVSWSRDGSLRSWEAIPEGSTAMLAGHSGSVAGAIALSPNRILSWSYDATLRLWDTQTASTSSVTNGHSASVVGVLDLPDSKVLTWSRDHTLVVWGEQTGSALAILRGHSATVTGARWLDDGLVLSWSEDKTLRSWDTLSGRTRAVFSGHSETVNGALALPDKRILSWAADCTLRLWDRESGRCLAVLKGHSGTVCGARRLNDGRILSWSHDARVLIWDLQTAKIDAILPGHWSRVLGTMELPKGKILSWSKQRLQVSDGRSGACLTVLKGHTGGICGAQATAEGTIFSWSTDQIVHVWEQEDGAPSVYSLGDAKRAFPVLQRVFHNTTRDHGHLSWETEHCAGLLHLPENPLGNPIRWEGSSIAKAHKLTSNGVALLTQDDGQVCFLQLHDGDRRIPAFHGSGMLDAANSPPGNDDAERPAAPQGPLFGEGANAPVLRQGLESARTAVVKPSEAADENIAPSLRPPPPQPADVQPVDDPSAPRDEANTRGAARSPTGADTIERPRADLNERNPRAALSRAIEPPDNPTLALVLTGDLEKVRAVLDENRHQPLFPLERPTPRLPLLLAILELAAGNTAAAATHLASLKARFLHPVSSGSNGSHALWDLRYFLEALAPQLPTGAHDLLAALLDIVNARYQSPPPDDLPARIAALDRFDLWRDATPQPRE